MASVISKTRDIKQRRREAKPDILSACHFPFFFVLKVGKYKLLRVLFVHNVNILDRAMMSLGFA